MFGAETVSGLLLASGDSAAPKCPVTLYCASASHASTVADAGRGPPEPSSAPPEASGIVCAPNRAHSAHLTPAAHMLYSGGVATAAKPKQDFSRYPQLNFRPTARIEHLLARGVAQGLAASKSELVRDSIEAYLGPLFEDADAPKEDVRE